MENHVHVSIIVPTYNTGYLLDKCLQSLVSQTYQNIEILICDDFSDDQQTVSIIEKYIAKYSSIIKHLKPNKKGANFAREIGIKSAKGEFITFVDSDDQLTLSAIEMLVSNILKYKSQIAIAKLIRVSITGDKVINDKITPIPEEEFINISSENINEYSSYLKPTLCGKLYSKSLFDNIDVENPPYFQDWNITYKILFDVRKISFINEFIYLYSYNENSFASSITKSNQEKINESWIAINGIMDFFKARNYNSYNLWMQFIVFNFLIALIGRSYFIDSFRTRQKIHKDCMSYWNKNFQDSHFKLNQKWYLKIILSSFMFSELARYYYIYREKKSNNNY